MHHTAGTNSYAKHEVTDLLRSIYRMHTGTKGWHDVAYNFFIDRYGVIWEGRTGSSDQPMKGDGTGGSQGFALLCCFIGDHSVEPPTPAAAEAMVSLLAWLADRYGIDTAPGSTATFVSRGSNKWPAGATVTTTTIAGHREMSSTECPGEAAFVFAKEMLPVLVTARRSQAPPPTTVAPSTTSTTTTTPSSSSVPPPPTDRQSSTTIPVSSGTGPSSTVEPAPTSAAQPSGGGAEAALPVGIGLTLVGAGVAVVSQLRKRRLP